MIGKGLDYLKNNLGVDISIYNIDNKNIWGIIIITFKKKAKV